MIKKYTALSFILVLYFFGYSPANAQAKLHKDISYVMDSALDEQKLDIYVPDNIQAKQNLPVHIYVHGGAWVMGDKSSINHKKAKPYTDLGIIIVSINYRLSPDVMHPAHIQDCAAAIKWVVDNITKYGGDPKNIVLSGHSAGAHLVALLGTHPEYLKAKGLRRDLFKAIMPVDTATFNLTRKQSGKLSRFIQKKRDSAFGKELETLIDASPILQIRKDTALSPFVVFVTAKRKDAVVQSRSFINKLKEKGHHAKTIIIDNGSSHRDMAVAIFDLHSVIFKTISEAVR